MSANKTWISNQWDENKGTLLDPDKGLYELKQAKQAVQAARNVAESVDSGAGELLKALNTIAYEPIGHAEASYREVYEMMTQIAKDAIAAHKARIAKGVQ